MSSHVKFGEFQIYLSHNGDRLFSGRDPFVCPIANFLREGPLEGTRDVTVVSEGYDYIRKGHRYAYKLPKWAQRFIKVVDSKFGDKELTGKRALVILNEVWEG